MLVGLGNPGPRYEATRHNVGFDALDRLLRVSGGRWNASSDSFVAAEVFVFGRQVTLLRPLTFMNASGGPVAEFVESRRIDRQDVLVYYDDVALPLGSLRLRPRGSSGGHNGLASILETLGSTDVPRFRIGIRSAVEDADNAVDAVSSVPRDLAEFVLAPFSVEERPVVHEVLDRVVDATRVVLIDGMTTAMSRFNGAIDRGRD